MKHIALLLTFCFLFIGCGKKEEDSLALGLIVNNPAHQVTVWLNDEPVKVCMPGQGGALPLRMAASKGLNRVWVSVERTGDQEGSVKVEIKEGSWAEPDKIKDHFSWESNEAKAESEKFEFSQESALGADRTSLDPISINRADAMKLARDRYRLYEEALKAKKIEALGFDEEKLNQLMKTIMGVDGFHEKVFEVEDYESKALSSAQDLEVVIGKRTILAYSQTGDGLFQAGSASQGAVGEMVYSFFVQSISLGQKDGEWQALY